ncbi:MAG TPA: succinate dehydrogenase assembly factor 2 [Burkholderiales bacterium]|nr:succinate dehydrogenase assembly factor 2 [Burkholderiales bacterium]
MDRIEHHRLRWKCRRGLLELDIVLERFLRNTPPGDGELAGINALLDLPDNDLWDIVAGRSDNYQPHLRELVARLRAA